jgi:molybdenum cofactor cytidylyltransferase
MQFGPVPVAEAAGAILAHSQLVGDVRWPKGRVLSADDATTAEAAGIATLTVARLGPDDVAEDRAAAALAARLASASVAALKAAHGRANLAARHDGVLAVDAASVAAINAVDEALTLATLAPFARVQAGEIVATVKVIRYAVAGAALSEAGAAAVPLIVHPFRRLRVGLIATRLPGVTDKALAKTRRVTRARVESLDCTMEELPHCPHDVAALAARLAAVGHDLLLIAGASATVDRADVIPAAIVAAGGRVERLGMPVDPGNLLCLGDLGGRPVIGLPGCARSPKASGFDWALERLVAGLPVTNADIAAMGVGGLLPEAERPEPRLQS